ncbi:phosphorylase family protein [Citrifermentans bremense]|uniref:phosphorylase family protein n=1 Tax=Citrifermentans bremense TaxID=60035 RepID=UPI00040A1C80|nr:nucleoside phosphorylase [Citrifermentans bremense]
MKIECLGAVAAMPQEIAPLLRRVRRFQKEKISGFNLYRFDCGSTRVALIESGMGPDHAALATAALIRSASPHVILNFGFCGGVLPGLTVGDLVLAERVFALAGGRLSEALTPPLPLTSPILESCRKRGLSSRRGSFITATGVVNKRALAQTLEGSIHEPVLEMESAAVFREAGKAGIEAVALRGVSDPAEEELGFDIAEICDSELNLSPWRLVLTLAKRPLLVPQLIRLARNSKVAGANLALGVELALLALSETQ